MTHVAKYGVEQHPIESSVVSDYGVIKPLVAWAPYFDGVDNYIELSGKLFDISGNIDFSFTYAGSSAVASATPVYVQGSSSGTTATIEFRLILNATIMVLIVGGVSSGGSYNYGVQPKDTVRITLIGNTLTWYINGVQVQSGTFNRGAVVSADPKAYVGRNPPGLMTQNYALGVIHNIKANGVLLNLHGNNVPSYTTVPPSVTGTPIGFTSADYRLVEDL